VNAPAFRSLESAQPPRALPAWVYAHPEMARLEYERVIKTSWQLVGHVNSIPRAGDYMTLDLGRDSVIAVRTSEGDIRAFHNVCRHRGAQLVEGSGHCPGTITCPYHGWSYRTSGELLAITARETFPGVDRSLLGLLPVRAQVAFGFLFVCLATDPPPLLDSWGPLAQELAPYRIEEMKPLGPLYIEHWDCDWKVAMDNYLESYHVPIGHPGLDRLLTRNYFDDHVSLPAGIARSRSCLREHPSPKWSERLYQQLIGGVSGTLPSAHRSCWSFYSMLPNLGIDVYPDQMDFFQVLPCGPGKCILRGGYFGHTDERREMRVVRYLGARINRQVQREDEFLCRRVQKGLASSAYEPGPLSRLEDSVLQFHELLRERIPEARELAAPARFA
jgi:phenylpropionate dioxygenase-like ring-hydroxylating dioxygenase large terminal subunit